MPTSPDPTRDSADFDDASGSDTADGDRRGGRRRWPRVVAVAVLTLALLEVAGRAAMTQLPDPLVWPRYEVQRKVERLDQLGRDGCIDTAVFGSSVANAAIDAGLLSELTGGRVYNLALGGSGTDTWPLWAEEIVVPTVCPERALIAVTVADLNASNASGDFQASYLNSLGRLDRLGDLSGWRQAKKFSWDNSGLFALQRSFRRPSDALSFAATGAGPWRVINDDFGTLTRFRDRGYDNSAARRNHDRTVVFADYSPGSEKLADLAALGDLLGEHGIETTFVMLPFTDETLDFLDDGQADVDAFVESIEQLAAELDAPLVNLIGVVTEREFFADDYHVNAEGASAVTEALHSALGGSG